MTVWTTKATPRNEKGSASDATKLARGASLIALSPLPTACWAISFVAYFSRYPLYRSPFRGAAKPTFPWYFAISRILCAQFTLGTRYKKAIHCIRKISRFQTIFTEKRMYNNRKHENSLQNNKNVNSKAVQYELICYNTFNVALLS